MKNYISRPLYIRRPLPALQQSGSRKYKQYIYDYAEGKGQCDA